jgi:hypothetical protein
MTVGNRVVHEIGEASVGEMLNWGNVLELINDCLDNGPLTQEQIVRE